MAYRSSPGRATDELPGAPSVVAVRPYDSKPRCHVHKLVETHAPLDVLDLRPLPDDDFYRRAKGACVRQHRLRRHVRSASRCRRNMKYRRGLLALRYRPTTGRTSPFRESTSMVMFTAPLRLTTKGFLQKVKFVNYGTRQAGFESRQRGACPRASRYAPRSA